MVSYHPRFYGLGLIAGTDRQQVSGEGGKELRVGRVGTRRPRGAEHGKEGRADRSGGGKREREVAEWGAARLLPPLSPK